MTGYLEHIVSVTIFLALFLLLRAVQNNVQYEILVAEETILDGKDRIPPMAVDSPLRLYSTLESGRFAIQGIERSVCDLTLLEQDRIEPGDIISKEVFCYVPKESTAYGVEFPYMTAQRTTGVVYFKPEYE